MVDIDNDDELEIIGVARYGGYVWEANGDKIWSQDIQYSGETSPPALGNVDEDEVDAYIQEYYQELSDQKRQEILEEIK